MDRLSPFRSIRRRIVATTSKYTMPSPPIFLGPPEIHPLPSPAPSQNHLLLVPSRKPPSLLSPFIDAMTALFKIDNNNLVLEEEKAVPKPKPPTCPMENVSPYFQSSGNPCLDLFNMSWFTPPEKATELLQRAWAHNPLTTLKLILRRMPDCDGDKKVCYTVVFWLHQNHPKTLALNVRWFAQVGYMEYLLDILFHEVAPQDVLKIEKEESVLKIEEEENVLFYYLNKMAWKRILAEKERLRPELARRAVERYNSDSHYRFLYDRISDFLVESLKTEIWFLDWGEFWKISGRAAAWCPSLDSMLEYSTLLCESIAKGVFPRESDPSYAQMDEAHYSYIVRERLGKEVLDPLLKVELPITPMPRRSPPIYSKYSKFFPERVPSVEALLPHEILSFLRGNNIDELTELKWKRMALNLSKKGKLSNCLCVCDVSGSMDGTPMAGSMDGTPMEVCVALGLLVSQLSEEPWRRNVINFSENPQMHRIEGKTLQEKVEFIKRMEWGINLDFQKVFDGILDVAVASKLEEEKMVKRVFVFTDMGFCEASENSWEADYHAIQRKYEEKGYGSSMPEIVFWNLKNFDIMPPVAGREKGVLLVSGFSKNLLNIFLDNGGVVNPEEVMEEAIAREVYKKVCVFD